MSKRKTYSLLGVMVLLVALFALSGVAWAATFSTPVDSDYTNVDNSVYVSQADFPSGAPAAAGPDARGSVSPCGVRTISVMPSSDTEA